MSGAAIARTGEIAQRGVPPLETEVDKSRHFWRFLLNIQPVKAYGGSIPPPPNMRTG